MKNGVYHIAFRGEQNMLPTILVLIAFGIGAGAGAYVALQIRGWIAQRTVESKGGRFIALKILGRQVVVRV